MLDDLLFLVSHNNDYLVNPGEPETLQLVVENRAVVNSNETLRMSAVNRPDAGALTRG